MAHCREISEHSGIGAGSLIKTLAKICDCSSNTIYTTAQELAIQQSFKQLSPKTLQKIGNLAFEIRMNKLKRGCK